MSTKYAKKVRRRLLSSLDGPKPAEPDPCAAAAATEPPAPSTPPAAVGAVSGSVFGSATAGIDRDLEAHTESRRVPNGAAVPRDALLPAEVKPKPAAAQPVVNHGALLAALLPKAKPRLSGRVRTEDSAANAAEHAPNGLLSSQMVRLSAYIAVDQTSKLHLSGLLVLMLRHGTCLECLRQPAAADLSAVRCSHPLVLLAQGMASSMGGGLLAHAVAAHQQQPGQYRGAAGLDMPDGGSSFAGYGDPVELQLPGSHLAAGPQQAASRQPDGGDSRLHSRTLSSGSDAVTPVSPLHRHANGGNVTEAGGAAMHSQQSSGWTGFDGPAFGSGGFMGTTFAEGEPAAGMAAARNGLLGTLAIDRQQHLISLYAVRQGNDLQLHESGLQVQHGDLQAQLQRTSLSEPDSDLQPDDCRLPSHVLESLFDDDYSDISEPSEVAIDMRDVRGSSLSAVGMGSARAEERLASPELIGNLDLYL